MLLKIYEIVWIGAIPVVISFSKARDGWHERLFLKEKGPYDVWIHGASVGEAYMASDIILNMDSSNTNILVTTNTPQGKEILIKQVKKERVTIRYFPFDLPSIMEKSISKWHPKVVVLLETELWPGFIYACNSNKVPVIVINGRLSERSFKAYMRFRSFWKRFSPDMIYAISKEDAQRYAFLFGKEKVKVMNNMKFDRVKIEMDVKDKWLDYIVPKNIPFIVLGSVRKEEERDILMLIKAILSILPDVIIGLFPRHTERVEWWKNTLYEKGIRWVTRSETSSTVSPGVVIIWDKFGELAQAYSRADAAFVGGSLRPCGGHNFLEPLSYGVIPCVGPFLENFRWIDKEIFDLELVIIVKDWEELAKKLIYQLIKPSNKEDVRKKFIRFIKSRRGGVKKACEIISSYLNHGGYRYVKR